jgi:predicted transcriptional regulator
MGGSFMGHIPVEKRTVVYLALEDNKRRLNHRMHKIGIEPPENFYIMTPAEWQGSIADLEKLLQENKEIGLIIIDTLFMFSPMQDTNSYGDTYSPVSRIQRISHRTNCAVVLVHHTRKQKDSGSWTDSGMGSQGLNGAVDTIVLLDKKDGSQDGTLKVRGRDIEESAYKIKWDKTICSWELIGETSLFEVTPTFKDEILKLLSENPEGLKNKDLCVIAGKDKSTVSRATAELIQNGKIVKTNDLFKLAVDNTLYSEKSTTVDNMKLTVNSRQHQQSTVVDKTDTREESTVNSEKNLEIW